MLWRFPREKTAIRHPNNLSVAASRAVTMKIIRPTSIVLDYGCGHGDDTRQLRKKGYHVRGWDPAIAIDSREMIMRSMGAPGSRLAPPGLVNVVLLSNVINVIEDIEERKEVLRGAFWRATEALVVTAYDEGKGKKWGDGVVTKAGTFQRPYTLDGFKRFLQNTLKGVIGDMWVHPLPNLAVVFTKQFDRATRKALGIAV